MDRNSQAVRGYGDDVKEKCFDWPRALTDVALLFMFWLASCREFMTASIYCFIYRERKKEAIYE